MYVKELAARLVNAHQVTVVTYARIPEKVAGVHIVSTSKQRPLPIRLLIYTLLLLRACRSVDVLYAQSGSSVGLPVVIVRLLRRIPLVVHVIEDEAWKRAVDEQLTKKPLGDFLAEPEGTQKIRFITRLQGMLLRRADLVVVSEYSLKQPIIDSYRVERNRVASIAEPAACPEILPFQPSPTEKLAAYNKSWDTHINALLNILKHV